MRIYCIYSDWNLVRPIPGSLTGLEVLTLPWFLSTGFTTERHHTKLAVRLTGIPAAADDSNTKVCWLVGMAGTGKSTISQTLCEILDGKNMLGASFLCSRASEKTRNERLIIPAIAHALAMASPSIDCEVVKAIEDDPDLAEPIYGNWKEQFKKLIYLPIRTSICQGVRTYKTIVIDAADECSDLEFVSVDSTP